MNRIEKLMKALPEGADAALITSDVNRRYFTGLGSTAGTLLAFRDAAYFIIDFRYIEVAKATVTGAEVILQDKLYDQLGELLKKHGARTGALETDYITVGSLEQYRSRLPQVEFLTAAALNDKILEMRSLKDGDRRHPQGAKHHRCRLPGDPRFHQARQDRKRGCRLPGILHAPSGRGWPCL